MEVLDRYLNDLTLDNEEFKSFLQGIMGLLYNNINKERKLVVFYGPGSGGKSILMDLLRAIMGIEYRVVSTNIIDNLAELNGVRCAVLNEIEDEENVLFWNRWVKEMTSGDQRVTQLNNNITMYTPTFVPVMITNQIPFDTTNLTIAKRVILVHFRTQFVSKVDPNNPLHRKCDQHLRDHLFANQEFMSAFSDWVREGALMHTNPIKEPNQD
jgi:phage/plasmid-associated DNA primase